MVASAPFDYLHEFGNVQSALLYSILFIPDFVEVDGSVLIKMGQEETFSAGKKSGAMSLVDLEASFNFIEVPYVFSDRDSTDGEDTMLATRIAEAWRARLTLMFPGRSFRVSVLPPSETGSVIGVQFYEIRS